MQKLLIIVFIVGMIVASQSQNTYELDQFTIASGGVSNATNLNYSLSATIGESSADVMKNNLYHLYYRFFPILLVTNIGQFDYALELPRFYDLKQNYPNPFNPVTTIKYMLPHHSDVNLDVFNSLGQHITSLQAGQQAPGSYLIQWDGKNRFGLSVASGEYFYLIRAKSRTGELFNKTKKMLLLK